MAIYYDNNNMNLLFLFASLSLFLTYGSCENEFCQNFSGKLSGLCQAYCEATKCGNPPAHASLNACTNLLNKITPLLDAHNQAQGTNFVIDENQCVDAPTCLYNTPNGGLCVIDTVVNPGDCGSCCSGVCSDGLYPVNFGTCIPQGTCPSSFVDILIQWLSDVGSISDSSKTCTVFGGYNRIIIDGRFTRTYKFILDYPSYNVTFLNGTTVSGSMTEQTIINACAIRSRKEIQLTNSLSCQLCEPLS